MFLSPRRWTVSVAIVVAQFALCTATGGAKAAEVSDKALKYHEVLLKRPEPGYLFDRFYNTWLDDATVEDLQTFLAARANETKATADQLLLAFFFAKQGDDVAALEEFRKALATNPGSALTLYQKALVETRTLDFEAAIADLRIARESNPDEKLAVLIDKQLGKLLVRNRQNEEALQVWNALLATNPQDEELAEDLVELEIDEGLYDEAGKLSEQLLERTKDPYLVVTRRLRLGDIHHRAGRREQALEAYAAALNDVGYDTWFEQEILAQTEQIFRREDNLAQLEMHYETLIKAHPKRMAVLERRAKLLVELGEQDPAVSAFRQILELTPGDRANREEFVEMLAKIGKHAEAIAEQRALSEQHPQDAELRYRLATLLKDGDQVDGAVATVDEYLAASDKSEYAYLRAARLLERFERSDDAARVYQAMATAIPDSPSAQEAYAGFLYKADKKDEALAIWRRLAADADLTQTLHVARALSTRNENAVALELLKARGEEFDRDPLYYSQLIQTALALKETEQAIPWARRRVELAETTSDLEAALDQAVAVCDRADKVETVADELAAMDRRPMQLTCLLAELRETAGDSACADETLAAAVAEGNVLAVGEQIRLASFRRDWKAAADATRRMLDLPGGRKSIHVRRLVEFCQRDFQLDEALTWIAEWKRLSPGSTTPWTTEATLLRLQGKDDDAIATLKTAVRQFEGNEDLRLRLAQAYAESDHLGDAERIYWQLYEETEDTTGKLRWVQELAKLAEQQGKVAQLVDSFEQRRRDNRQSIVPLLALSEIHRTADNYEGRRAALMAATKIKPDDLELLHHIARIDEQQGDWEAAVATLERAVPLDKTNRTRERIAKLHLAYGNPDDGFAILFELAGGQGEPDPRTFESIADAMCGIQEWERAADFLAEPIADFPADYRLRYLFAVANEEAGRTDEAIAQFLLLLDDQEEFPEVAKKQVLTPQAMQASYYQIIGQITPPGVLEWIELSQSRYTAYSHQQQGGMGLRVSVSMGGMSGPASTANLPAKVDAVRSMAIAHLVTLGQLLDEDESEQLVRDFTAKGIAHAGLLMRVGPESQNMMATFAEVLDENPDDEVALALVVIQRLGSREQEMAKYAGLAAEKFADKYPQLAFMGAIQAGIAEEAENAGAAEDAEGGVRKNKWLDQALAIAEPIEDANPMVAIALASMLAGPPFNQAVPEVQDYYREQFSQQLLAWYPSLAGSQPYGQYAFVYVLAALSQDKDPKAFIEFLEDEVVRWHEGTRGPMQNQMAMFGRGQPGQLLEALTFPPQELADFPAAILGVLGPQNGNDPFSSMTGQAMSGEFDAEQAAKLVPDVRDPVLRLLLASRFELTELLDATLKEMVEAEQPRLDAYLLAAGKASSEERHADAVALLAKARYLPMNRDIRRRVDAAIVASVTTATRGVSVGEDADDESGKELVEQGKAAALRLRQARLNAEERTQLIVAMEELGLDDEAKKLDQVASAQATASPSGAVYAAAAMRSSPTAPDRVAQLIADGKRDAALKLLSNELLSLVRQVITNPGNSSYYMGYQGRQLKQRIDGFSMADELLKELDPGDSTNTRRVTEYAVACEIFERKDEARKAYERMLAERERDDQTRIRLLVLLAADGPDAVRPHLDKLTPAASLTLGQTLVSEMHQNETDLATRIGLGELCGEYLALVADERNVQTGWSASAAQALAQQMYVRNGNNLPSLYNTKEREEKLTGERAELQQRRIAAHRRLCEQMMAIGDSARSGFTHLLAAAEAGGEASEDAALAEFANLAEQALRREAESRPTGPNQYGGISYYMNSNPGEVRLSSPEEFLVRRGAKADDWTMLDELQSGLNEAANKTPGRDLERIAKLYRCPPDDFLAAAEEIARQNPAAMQGMDNDGDLALILAAWGDRKLPVDLTDFAIKQLERLAKGQNHHQPPAFIVDMIETVLRDKGADAAVALLDRVTEVYLGPADRRADFLKKNAQQNSISYGQPSGRIYVYGELFGQMAQRESLLMVLLAFMQGKEGFEILGGRNNLAYYTSQGVTNLADGDAAQVLARIDGSPWLADLDKFHPLDGGASGQRSSMTWLSHFLRELKNRHEDLDKLKELVAARLAQRPTFGLALFDAHLRGEDALIEFVASQLDALAQLDDARRTAVSFLIWDLIPQDYFDRDNASDATKAVQRWLEIGKNTGSLQALERLNSIKRIEELGIETYQIGEHLAELLRQAAPGEPQTAADVFFKIIELVHDAQRRNVWNSYFGSGSSTAAALLAQALNGQQDQKLDRLALIAKIVGSERDVAVEYMPNQLGVSNVLDAAWNVARQKDGGGEHSWEESLDRFQDQLTEGLAGARASLFVDDFYQLLHNRISNNEASQAEALAWAQASAAADGSADDVAHALRTTIVLAVANLRNNDHNDDDPSPAVATDDPDAAEAWLLEQLADPTLPLAWRMNLVKTVVRRTPRPLPAAIAEEALKTYLAALAATTPLPDDQEDAALRLLVGVLDEPAFDELVAQWQDAWAARYLRGRAPAGSREQPNQVNAIPLATAALGLYLKRGDDERVNLMLRHYDDLLGTSTLPLVALLRADKIDLAARFLRSHWRDVSLQWSKEHADSYDAIAATVEKLAAALTRDDERLFARALVAAMRSDGEAANEGLAAVAEDFASVKFEDQQLKNRTLVILARNPSVADRLQAAIAEQYALLSLPTTIQQDEDGQWRIDSELAVLHFANEFHAGRWQDYVEAFDQMAATADSQYGNGDAAYRMEPIVRLAYDSLKREGAQWSPEQCAAVAKSYRGLLAGKEYVYLNYFRLYSAVLLLTSVRGDQAAELSPWYDKLSENCQSWLGNNGLEDDFWQTAAASFGEPTAENREARLKFAADTIVAAADIRLLRWFPGRRHEMSGNGNAVISRMIEQKFLSTDDVNAFVESATEAAAEGDAPHFRVLAVFADWLREEEQRDKAAQLYEQAAAAAPEEPVDQRVGWLLDAAILWAKHGDATRADELAKKLAALELSGDVAARREKLDQEIKQALEPAGKDAAEAEEVDHGGAALQAPAADPASEAAAEPAADEAAEEASGEAAAPDDASAAFVPENRPRAA